MTSTNKKYYLLVLLLVLVQWLPAQEAKETVKTILIPAALQPVKNPGEEIILGSLFEQGIYKASGIYLIDNFLYLAKESPSEIIKSSQQGFLLQSTRFNNPEKNQDKTIGAIRSFKDNLAVLDPDGREISFYTKDLKFIDKLSITPPTSKTPYLDFIINNKNEWVFFGSLYGKPDLSYYFAVYTEKGEFVRNFAESVTNLRQNMDIMLGDAVQSAHYTPEQNATWACFKNRYDLRCYQDEKWKLEIKAPEGFFKGEEKTFGQKKRISYQDQAIYLAMNKNLVFYFFQKDAKTFCDIIDPDNSTFKRIELLLYYISIVHYNDNIFFGLGYDIKSSSDLLLVKFNL